MPTCKHMQAVSADARTTIECLQPRAPACEPCRAQKQVDCTCDWAFYGAAAVQVTLFHKCGATNPTTQGSLMDPRGGN
eukprot:CAMPEP_0204123288 /NCGR_PEP_ID=MMETSP0361-20130328/9210_1 /ASSEMBLY_ACC=CAM_ASM_000343 /TAXON_ID=268821 /ORGANISM="Scrippsiella Hangoei, Strain SHTV-5" /LENGTH=77 /DNA_ID=CAMNT_0051074725 /DNA_START=149 /DNA_END=382 /DNA_ORIENTATION=+